MVITDVLTEGTIVRVMALKKRQNKVTYGRKGRYIIINANAEKILIQKEKSNYRECISIIDLITKRYKLILENGSILKFERMNKCSPSKNGYRWPKGGLINEEI